MKELKLPFISGLEKNDFKTLQVLMEEKAAKAFISQVNWEEYPYQPTVGLSVARSETHLVALYNVCSLDLRAIAMEDHGKVWEDSCCEMFISDPCDGTYYNFELNCIGTMLAAKRTGRNDPAYFTEEQMKKIIRHSSLERKEYNENGDIHRWTVAMCIPFELFGVNAGNLPEYIRANFYKCADMTAHPHFLSWNKIEIEKPDFHRPDFFGKIFL